MDVGGWLRGLGLGQYEEKFRDNKIDADLLPRLTVDDLKDIGVSVVCDRRRLLDAIAVIAGAGRPADVPASPTKSAPSKGLQASAERRPITVMFCDLVGSTSLAAEDWRNLVNAYLDDGSGNRARRPCVFGRRPELRSPSAAHSQSLGRHSPGGSLTDRLRLGPLPGRGAQFYGRRPWSATHSC